MSRFLAYQSNMAPGADPDGGASDSYTCEECGGSFDQSELDAESNETICKECAAMAAEQDAGELAEFLVEYTVEQLLEKVTAMQAALQRLVEAVEDRDNDLFSRKHLAEAVEAAKAELGNAKGGAK